MATTLSLPHSFYVESVEEHRGKKTKTKKKQPGRETSASQKSASSRGGRRGKRGGKRKQPHAEAEEDGGEADEGEEEGEEANDENDSMSSVGSEVQLSEEENTEIKDSIRQLTVVRHVIHLFFTFW